LLSDRFRRRQRALKGFLIPGLGQELGHHAQRRRSIPLILDRFRCV
jgi:hypothetical protein